MTANPRLAFVTRGFYTEHIGGGESYVWELWKRAAADFDVSLVSAWVHDPSRLPPGTVAIPGKKLTRPTFYMRFARAAKRGLRGKSPALVHASCPEGVFPDWPTVLTVHHLTHLLSGSPDQSSIAWLQRPSFLKRVRRARALIAMSDQTRNDLAKLGVPKESVEVIYPGVDHPAGEPPAPADDRVVVLVPSRIVRSKGQAVAARAFAQLPDATRDRCELRIVGLADDEAFASELRMTMKGLRGEVRTNLTQDEMTREFERSSVVIFPTLQGEGFGRVVAEAMAFGRPLLCSDTAVMREVAGDGARFFAPGDARRLSTQLGELVEDEALRADLGHKGKERARREFTWEQSYARTREIYRRVLEAAAQ